MMITSREAKRIAIQNIIDVVQADLVDGGSYWQTDPETKDSLTLLDAAKVEREARGVLETLARRASRLRSLKPRLV